MSKASLAFKELIEQINSSVKSGKIEQDYSDFLKRFRDLGVSSYILNKLIQKAKESTKEETNKALDESFFVISEYDASEENNEPQSAEPKEVEVQVIEKTGSKAKFAICLFLIIGIVEFFYLLNLQEKNNHMSDRLFYLDGQLTEQKGINSTTGSELSDLKKKNEELTSNYSELKSSFSKYMPIIITDVQLANVYNDGSIETDFGGSIYSSSSMFIKPKLTYEGIDVGANIQLKVKFYTPSDQLSRGSGSPSDCSWTESFEVYSGSNKQSLQGWGGDAKGHWSSGTYRYEFWYNNVCLRAKTFTVY